MGRLKTRKLLLWLPLCVILLAWTILYIPHLRTSPRWYIDECSALDIAVHTAQGKPVYMAMWNTYFHPVAPYQPVYSFLAGIFAQDDILGARFFNALIALIISLLIFFIGKRFLKILPAFFAALIFLCYEQSVLHFRMVFPHNGAALGFALAALFLLRPARMKNDLMAGLGLVLAAASHPLFVHAAIASGIIRLKKPRSWLPLFAPLAIYLSIILALLYHQFGVWLIEDMKHLSTVYHSDSSQHGFHVLLNIWRFFTQDWFHITAAIGFFCCFTKRFYKLAILIGTTSFLLLQNRQNLTLFYYQAVVILPLLGLSWGALIFQLQKLFLQYRSIYKIKKINNYAIFTGLALIPLFCFGKIAPSVFQGTLKARNDYWATQSTDDVEAAAEWINAHTRENDLVIAGPCIAWLLKTQKARWLQATAWEGLPTFSYESPVDKKRYLYEASLDRAKYAVVGDIDVRWTFFQPNVDCLFSKIKGKWEVVWRASHYVIFANPNQLKQE